MKNIYSRKKRKLLITLASILLIISTLFISAAVYVGDHYDADEAAVEEFLKDRKVRTQTCSNGSINFGAWQLTRGLIFYPGGKVDERAYIPLMQACAEEGIFCIVAEMPFNLAVLDKNIADEIKARYTGITEWYIGGHSLGGSMAAAYLKKNAADYDGLILLGSYSASDLSDTSLPVLSIYGSEDEILDMEKYEKNKDNLPKDFTEIVIDGGCHSYFGMYGMQKGDGTPTITNVQQIEMTADYISEFILGK